MKQNNRKRSMIWGIVTLAAFLCFLLAMTVQADPPYSVCTATEDGQHNWTVTESEIATCGLDGFIWWYCTACGEDYWETLPALGHIYREGWEQVTAPTCESEGLAVRICSRCGDEEYATIPALGHSWNGGVVTQAATCETDGVLTYTCYNCGLTWSEPIYHYGHNWDGGVVTVRPTCTTDGVYTYTCYNCGLTWSEPIAAYGHNWSEGVVTQEPEGFEPGVKTYTCYNCGLLYTEPVSAAPSLFHQLRNLPPAGKGPDDLYIVQQPEGGTVSNGYGSEYPFMRIPISIEVGGGMPPYTFEWHFRQTDIDSMMSPSKIAGLTGASEDVLYDVLNGYKDALADWGETWASLYAKTHGESPETGSATDVELLIWSLMNNNDVSLTSSQFNISTLDGYGGRSYYCVVTDAAGGRVVSDLVQVRSAVSLKYLNKNQNVEATYPYVMARAQDGKEPYSYYYFLVDENGNGQYLEDMEGESPPATHYGEMYYIVEDAYGDTARSNNFFVYSVDEFRIVSKTEGKKIRENETADVWITLMGGIPPYTVTAWFVDEDWNQEYLGELTGVDTGNEDTGSFWEYHYTADKPGRIVYYCSDSMGNQENDYISTEINVYYRQLAIKTQPEGGILPLPEGSSFELNVEMGEGTEPFTYELYRINLGWELEGVDYGDLYDSGDSGSMKVYETGTYYYIIRDALGRWARSDYARVVPYEITLKTSGDAEIENKVTTLYAEASGGEEPYTYEWKKYEFDQYGFVPIEESVSLYDQQGIIPEGVSAQFLYRNDPRYLRVYQPGTYICNVTDVNGGEAGCMLNVTYTGADPFITKEPQDVRIPWSIYEPASTTLTCEAVSGTGDDSNLLYFWEKKDLDKWISVGTGPELELKEDGTKEGQISGCYRCKVADRMTEKEVYSQEAYVTVEMKINRVEQTGPDSVKIVFDGGLAPYFVTGYLYCYDGHYFDPLKYQIKHWVIHDPEDAIIDVDGVGTDSKVKKMKNDHTFYYEFVIEDYNGEKISDKTRFYFD